MTKAKKVPPPDELEPPLPPDGGWGWAVMIASFFSNLLVDGVLYTFGILLTYLTHSFPEAGTAQISLAGSLLGGMYLIVGQLSLSIQQALITDIQYALRVHFVRTELYF